MNLDLGTRMAPWTRKVMEAVEDGAWHNRTELIAIAGAIIPAGKAYRRGEKDRKYGGGPAERLRGDEQESILSGRTSIVNESIHHLTTEGLLERRADGRAFRLGSCRTCGQSLRKPEPAQPEEHTDPVKLAEDLLGGFRLDGARAVVTYDDAGAALLVLVGGREFELRVRDAERPEPKKAGGDSRAD